MAGIKISALPAVPGAQTTDIFPVVQAGVTSRETISQLISLINSPSILTAFVPITGGTMSGPLILSGDPTLALGAATKQYVDQFAAGIKVILAAEAATTVNLNATQAGAGVGATLTNAGAMAAFAVDGYSANLNDRILVKNQTLTQHNGVYTVTTVGSGAVNWVLTRATDYDQPAEIKPGTLVPINNGTVNANTSWVETATVTTVDTNPILFSQFSFSSSSFLLKANNLSDVASVATSLVNLGLGTPVGTGNVILQTSPTLITPNIADATANSLTFSPTTNGIVGTPTNDSATTGFVGEFVSSIVAGGAPVSLSSGVAKDLTSISLTAGDWDVWGNIDVNSNNSTGTTALAWLSSTSATIPDASLSSTFVLSSGLYSQVSPPVPQRRFSLSGTTTVYLSAIASFNTGAGTMTGAIYARRVR